MRHLILSIIYSCVGSNLCVAEELKAEVIPLLKVMIEQSQGVPPSMTPDKFYGMLKEEIDFEVSEADLALLKEGKSLRDSNAITQVLADADVLKSKKLPVSEEQLLKVIKEPSTDVRTFEAAYRMLSHFNQMKFKQIIGINIMSAKTLTLGVIGENPVKLVTDIEGYNDHQFMYLGDVKEDWLYSPKGFGELGDAADFGGKVMIMAPRMISGKLIVGCDNGSVYSLPLEKVRDRIDISKVKLDQPKQDGAVQPEAKP